MPPPEPTSSAALAFFDAETVHRALDYRELISTLGEVFRAGGEAPVRHHHAIDRPGAAAMTLLLMPAWQAGEALGVKLATVTPGNEAHGLRPGRGSEDEITLFKSVGSALEDLAAARLVVVQRGTPG